MLEKKDMEAIEKILDKRLGQSENIVLDQMERTRRILEDQIGQIKKNIEDRF